MAHEGQKVERNHYSPTTVLDASCLRHVHVDMQHVVRSFSLAPWPCSFWSNTIPTRDLHQLGGLAWNLYSICIFYQPSLPFCYLLFNSIMFIVSTQIYFDPLGITAVPPAAVHSARNPRSNSAEWNSSHVQEPSIRIINNTNIPLFMSFPLVV